MKNPSIAAAQEAVLEIKDLSVRFGDFTAANKVTFNVKRGETVALVGESGSGKSVTALSILQLLPYPIADHPSGSIKVNGVETVGAKTKDLNHIRGRAVSMIFQEPMSSLNPLHRIEKQISEILQIHRGISIKKARPMILELLELVGLQNPEAKLKSFPHELSGGQRQRVMIAMALANEPDLLIADEPTTALDVTVQAQILELLKNLQQRIGMGLLLITHDLGIVREMANRVCVMNSGEVVEEGECGEIFSSPKHNYTRHLLAAQPRGEPQKRQQHGILLECRNLSVKFPLKNIRSWFSPNYFCAVDGVSFKVPIGQTLGIVGESGSGKTTLGLALLRLVESDGEVFVKGNSIHQLNKRALRTQRRHLQIVFQDPFSSLSPRLSVHEIVAEGLRIHDEKIPAQERRSKVSHALKDVGLDPQTQDRYPHEFSGGQRQRIAIARALILKPELLILDEPTSALDMSVQAQIVDLLRQLQQRHQLTYLFISHDLKVIQALSDHVIVMKDGRIVESGTTTEIFEKPQTEYTRKLIAASFHLAIDPKGSNPTFQNENGSVV